MDPACEKGNVDINRSCVASERKELWCSLKCGGHELLLTSDANEAFLSRLCQQSILAGQMHRIDSPTWWIANNKTTFDSTTTATTTSTMVSSNESFCIVSHEKNRKILSIHWKDQYYDSLQRFDWKMSCATSSECSVSKIDATETWIRCRNG